MKHRGLVESASAASSTTSAPVASAAGNVRFRERARRRAKRAPACSAQIAARWLLPEPSGPTSATIRFGQSGQLSISVSAAAFDGPPRKSSRA